MNYTRIWPGALLEMVGEFTKTIHDGSETG